MASIYNKDFKIIKFYFIIKETSHFITSIKVVTFRKLGKNHLVIGKNIDELCW